MLNDPVLNHVWLPLVPLRTFAAQNLIGVRLLGQDLVVWKCGDEVLVWQDLCIHRGTRLSLGQVRANTLQCPYHGWTYDAQGKCIHMPAYPEQNFTSKVTARPSSIANGSVHWD